MRHRTGKAAAADKEMNPGASNGRRNTPDFRLASDSKMYGLAARAGSPPRAMAPGSADGARLCAVSYTHLTLPTILLV